MCIYIYEYMCKVHKCNYIIYTLLFYTCICYINLKCLEYGCDDNL